MDSSLSPDGSGGGRSPSSLTSPQFRFPPSSPTKAVPPPSPFHPSKRITTNSSRPLSVPSSSTSSPGYNKYSTTFPQLPLQIPLTRKFKRMCLGFLPRSKTRLAVLFCTSIAGLLLLIVILIIGEESGNGLGSPIKVIMLEDLHPKDPNTGLPIEISRSFEEPDYALLSAPQPHTIGCDAPLAMSEMTADGHHKLLLLGVFSMASKSERRSLLRNIYKADFPPHLIEFKFVFGRPKDKEEERLLAIEQEEFRDIVIVDCPENIDEGKTHAWFKWAATPRGADWKHPRFVMKADDDTFLVMPNLVSAFINLDCSKNIYWGTSTGKSYHFPYYFRGLGYALSWPLAEWIGKADITPAHNTKIEDARTAQWLRNLDPVTDPVTFIDNGWMMGDFNQLDLDIEIIALHWLKHDDWFESISTQMKAIWFEARRPYTADNGVDPAVSIEKGKREPQKAIDERARQKAMGWDV